LKKPSLPWGVPQSMPPAEDRILHSWKKPWNQDLRQGQGLFLLTGHICYSIIVEFFKPGFPYLEIWIVAEPELFINH
jgi:hypothetical protein